MKWIKIEDKIPEMLENILFWHPDNGKVMAGSAFINGVLKEGYSYQCSHWMKFPKPPKDNKNETKN